MHQVVLFLLLLSGSVTAQSIKGDLESDFAFKVKQIDEFIDRFNHAPQTLARQYDAGLTHRENLHTLFDQHIEDWDYALIEEFVDQIGSRSGEKILDFYDPLWYAELECSFSYRGTSKLITLILQNQLAQNGGSKWVIVSVLEFLDGVYCEDIPQAKNAGFYLHPMSHVTNFMELDRAFEDKENLQNIFDPWNQGMDFLAFKNGVLKGTLKYQSNHRITYHFLQLEGWIFTVDYFPRQAPNAGWLISSLQRASGKEKQRYLAEKLNLL